MLHKSTATAKADFEFIVLFDYLLVFVEGRPATLVGVLWLFGAVGLFVVAVNLFA